MYAGNLYADIPRGIFLVRGENVLLLGEIVCIVPSKKSGGPRADNVLPQDLDKEDEMPTTVQRAPFQEVFELKKQEDAQRKTGDKKRQGKLQCLGFEPEHSGEILF